jgi:ribosomal protein S18 acetylase RimI-like enzyme
MRDVGLREYDPRTDLDALYDLAEVAYVEDYARIGRSAKAGMDRERRLVALLSLLGRFFPKLRDAQPGFVYEADGALVSVVLFARVGLAGDRWSIETVATHPAYRRHGLARMLVTKAIEAIRDRGGSVCTLKVRSDNPGAYALYRNLGFTHYDSTAHLKLCAAGQARAVPAALAGYAGRAASARAWFRSWRERHDLAVRETPAEVQRILPVSVFQFRRPAFVSYLAPLVPRLAGLRVERHLIDCEGRLVATLAVNADDTGEKTHEFSLVIDPAHQERLAPALVDRALGAFGRAPDLPVLTETRETNTPTLRALESRGFEAISTWHWLGLRLEDAG